MSRPTKAALIARVEIIQTLLLLGLSRSDILQYIAKKYEEWQVSPRTIDNYIKKATIQIKAAAEHETELELGRLLKRLELLYKKDMEIQDYKAALAVLKERAKILDLYPDSGPGIEVNLFDPSEWIEKANKQIEEIQNLGG